MKKLNNKRNVLLVEDNNLNLRVMSKLLQTMGIFVTESASGDEAVKHAIDKEYSMILICVFMPESIGYDTTKKIRELGVINKNTPIIAVSSFGNGIITDDMVECGITDITSKPLKEEALNNLFDKHIIEEISSEFEIFNSEAFESFYNGDILKKEIISIFLKEKDSDTNRISKAFNSKDKDMIYNALHYMKGSFSYLKANTILKFTQQILDLLMEEKLSDALLMEKSFIAKYNLLIEELNIHITKFDKF
jgi:CheY-like chemotaxis protein